MGAPAVMFDDIPGFPRGRRVVANIPHLCAAESI